MRFFKNLVKGFLTLTLLTFTFIMVLPVNAGIVDGDYLSDSFDKGLEETKWQVVNDTANKIGFFGSAGTMRYVNPAGAEETLVTTNPVNTGEGVTGYSVQFDFAYAQANTWGEWFGFAFYKTSAVKGVAWGQSGLLFGRTSSFQTIAAGDTVDGAAKINDQLTSFESMTPTIPVINGRNITFKFVYTNATKKLDMYYDEAGANPDLTTLRNSFTFGGLAADGAYHFAIISSGIGFYEVDNMVINKITATDPVNYLNADFETADLPAELTLLAPESYTWGPAKAVHFNNADNDARFITKNSYVRDANVDTALNVAYDLNVTALAEGKRFGFIYGLTNPNDALTADGVSYVYFKNVGGKTSLGATLGDGTNANQVHPETSLDVDITTLGKLKISLEFKYYGIIVVRIDGAIAATINAGESIGYFGFCTDDAVDAKVDNFKSTTFTYDNTTGTKDLYNNFNTGYLNPNDWEIDNYRDLKAGTTVPMFPTAKGIYVENGKLIFDVAGESAGFFTKPSFSDFEMRFTLSNYGVPTTPTVKNDDDEDTIDGSVVPQTNYLAISMGHTSIEENIWNVRSIIIQTRWGVPQIYTMNTGDSTVTQYNQNLFMDGNANVAYQVKVLAKGGTVQVWIKRASDPVALFEGAPIVTYTNVDHTGRIAIASSASGSFKIDDLSIVRAEDHAPAIIDEINPIKLIGAQVIVNTTLPKEFVASSVTSVDFKPYFIVSDNVDGSIAVTDTMLNLGGFDVTKPGDYTITLTVKDSDNNETIKTLVVKVLEPEPVAPANPVLVGIISGALSLLSGAAIVFFIFKKRL